MSDTTSRVERRFRELLMQKTGEQRCRMALDMFDDARALVVAGIRHEQGELDPVELKVQIFLRTYGQELPASKIARVVSRIRRGAAPPEP